MSNFAKLRRYATRKEKIDLVVYAPRAQTTTHPICPFFVKTSSRCPFRWSRMILGCWKLCTHRMGSFQESVNFSGVSKVGMLKIVVGYAECPNLSDDACFQCKIPSLPTWQFPFFEKVLDLEEKLSNLGGSTTILPSIVSFLQGENGQNTAIKILSVFSLGNEVTPTKVHICWHN